MAEDGGGEFLSRLSPSVLSASKNVALGKRAIPKKIHNLT